MNNYVTIGDLKIAPLLHQFVTELLPETGPLSAKTLWLGFQDILQDLAPANRALLDKRASLQAAIDQWHRDHPGPDFDQQAYQAFLTDIGYLVPEGPDFQIETTDVDAEISTIAGPQLVVPVQNARFALNAANARWGSLYDALYGTDAIPFAQNFDNGGPYDTERGAKVVEYAADFMDRTIPLQDASHRDVTRYFLYRESAKTPWRLHAAHPEGGSVPLAHPEQFRGYLGHDHEPSTLLFKHNDLHIELQIDRRHPVGAISRAGIKDVILEAALTVIQDLEDAVATVDAEDKVAAYRNWAGLMDGTLETQFLKNNKTVHRRLNQDRIYLGTDGSALTLRGRSLMLIRNVGHFTTTQCVLDADGKEVPEGFLDALVTTLCALPNLKGESCLRNGDCRSLYVVKPKMHGPDEVALADQLFARVEDLLSLPRNTLKIGVMDEEKRTSVNLKECIRAVRQRIVFINTGFLDRTGDEIHTGMEAGPVKPKEQIKAEPWLQAYEQRNVAIGLACGFIGKAQIGKGMWPKPDEMAQMLASKQAHLQAGANCAWVPSPTAAVLHAMHYHDINVKAVQHNLAEIAPLLVDDLFRLPLLSSDTPAPAEIEAELANNLQGILGYVVRWIDQGIGCSTVPDIHNVGLMEDRATLRISSQHVANWLHHGLCSEHQVKAILRQVATIVDQQNADDPKHRPIAPSFKDSLAFQAAEKLVLEGRNQPSGYTELILQKARLEAKQHR